MALETMIKLMIAIVIITAFTALIMKIITPEKSQTQNSFKTLGAEVSDIIKELKAEDSSEITVPIYMEKGWTINTINKEEAVKPKSCREESCITLSKNNDISKTVDAIRFKNIHFTEASDYIRSSQGGIVNVKITAKKEDKIQISLELE